MRSVFADAVKNTFGTTDMTTYTAILAPLWLRQWHGMRADAAQTDRGGGHNSDTRLHHRASSAALAFIC